LRPDPTQTILNSSDSFPDGWPHSRRVGQIKIERPPVILRKTPACSSWLNQVESWFAKIQRDLISGGIFTSVADRAGKLRKYIGAYAKSAGPFRWTYADPGSESVFTESPGRLTRSLRTEQQVNVLGHHHVANHDQDIALADRFQDRRKDIAAAGQCRCSAGFVGFLFSTLLVQQRPQPPIPAAAHR